MPSSLSASASASPPLSPAELLTHLASPIADVKFKALRYLKNRIIGNPTKKLTYISHGVVSAVSDVISAADPDRSDLFIESATVLGSFANGVDASVADAGVSAIINAGAYRSLVGLLSHGNEKVVGAGARALKLIYQSKLAPKYCFLVQRDLEYFVSLLNSENEYVTGLGASIITHSCETASEQTALRRAGVLKKLTDLLEGSINQREASLESIATAIRNNVEAVTEFGDIENGRALKLVFDLTKDRNLRTRLLAAKCLVIIWNSCPNYLQEKGTKTKLVSLLLELQEAPDQVGDEAPFVFSSLISEDEDLQKLAFEADAISKLYNHLQKDALNSRRFGGLLMAMANLCSKLEMCRAKFLSLKALNLVVAALTHESSDVRAAACFCLRSVSRSIKCLCAGEFTNETTITPLVQLLQDANTSVQVAALGALCNVVVDFNKRRSIIEQCGGTKLLVQLSTSMDSALRFNALWALRNLVFLADKAFKESVLGELTVLSLTGLICDSEPSVQEQALAFLRNLVDGSADCIDFIFAEDGILLDAVGRQLQNASKAKIGIQGMYVLCNVSSGNEVHKDAVTHQLVHQADSGTESFVIKFLQSSDAQLRTATVWTIINLMYSSVAGVSDRVLKLRSAGILSQLQNMSNDPCMETKLRVKLALGQIA